MFKISDAQYALAMIFFGALGLFNLLAFMALHLDEVFSLSYTAITAIIGVPIMIAGLGSWLGGRVADRSGAVPVIRYGFSIYMIIAVTLFIADHLAIVIVAVLAIGVIRAMTVPAMKSLMVLADTGDGSIYRIRHMIIILAFGMTALGATVIDPEGHRVFFVVGAGYFFIAVLISLLRPLSHHHISRGDATHSDARLTRAERRQLWLITLYGFLAFFSIAQFESSFPLYLRINFGALGEDIYRQQIMLSAFATLGLALVNNYVMSRHHAQLAGWPVYLGSVLSALSLLLLFGVAVPGWIFVGTVIYAIGEVMLLPLIDAMTAPMTRAGNRAQVLGLVELRQVAFFAGPVMGGFFLDHSPGLLPWALAVVALCVIPVYRAIGWQSGAKTVGAGVTAE